jgi:hypothetical protein
MTSSRSARQLALSGTGDPLAAGTDLPGSVERFGMLRCATRLPRLRCLHEQHGRPEAVYSWGRNRIPLSVETTDVSRKT